MGMPSLNFSNNQAQAGQASVAPQGPSGQAGGPSCPSPDTPPKFAPSSPGGSASAGGDEEPGLNVRPTRQILPAAPSVPVAPKNPPPRRSANLRPALISGDRDWVIFIECRANSLVVYPSRQEIPVAALGRGPNNPLVQQVRQMIDRKQATVRPGDMPYRPHVRFLVRPQFEATFYQAYPSLDGLTVPKSRQTLEPEDNVQEIIAGW